METQPKVTAKGESDDKSGKRFFYKINENDEIYKKAVQHYVKEKNIDF